MTLSSNFLIGILRNGNIIYVKLRKKCSEFLPTSQIRKFLIFTKELFRFKIKTIFKNFDPVMILNGLIKPI